jgi:hypothetical protein
MGCSRENENRDNDRDRRIHRNRDEQAVKEGELSKREKRAYGLWRGWKKRE